MMQFRSLHSEFRNFCPLLWAVSGQNLRQIVFSLDSCSHNFIRDYSLFELFSHVFCLQSCYHFLSVHYIQIERAVLK